MNPVTNGGLRSVDTAQAAGGVALAGDQPKPALDSVLSLRLAMNFIGTRSVRTVSRVHNLKIGYGDNADDDIDDAGDDLLVTFPTSSPVALTVMFWLFMACLRSPFRNPCAASDPT